MMPTQSKLGRCVQVVPEENAGGLCDHGVRAAQLITNLLQLWQLTLTDGLTVDAVARQGLHLVMANMRAVELDALARKSENGAHLTLVH
jgi:hypothetical protein